MNKERRKKLAQRFHESTMGCHPENMPVALEKLILVVAAEAREDGRKEGIEEMRPGIEAVEGLINNSHGVDGLHLNGDIAPWDELRTGGIYMEWLREFDRALERLKEQE